MNSNRFIAKRVVRSYTQIINAEPEMIFPLLCPEREKEWLDGWDYKLIYSKTGLAEEGAVFSTSYEGEEDTIWIITKHDKENGIVEFARVTPFNYATLLNIKITNFEANKSYVDIRYTVTGLSETGNLFVEDYEEESFNKRMKFWEDSMNYFFETGKTLKK